MSKSKSESVETVNIRPGVSILSVLSRLNYKPWYAIAEFVDNSIQSYLNNRQAISKIDGKKSILKIKITYDPRDGGTLKILDNAGGISEKQFVRAFRPAEVPADTSGLHEYGMGMKSAACWFSPNWTVRTSPIGQPYIKMVKFDIEKIVDDEIEELKVDRESASKDLHFTEILLKNLHRPLQTKTVPKIKSHLSSIYRHFIEEGTVEIDFDGILSFQTPKILSAPYFKNLKGPAKKWSKVIDLNLGRGKKVTGFAAIRETASTSEAGFALFRKKRLIQGSHDETWRPEELFGAPNKFTYQRVFGELHLSGFEVSHTKDGFVWEDMESTLIEMLERELSKSSLDILGQAEGHRTRATSEDIAAPVKRALQSLGPSFTKDLSKVIEKGQKKAKTFTDTPPKTLRTKAANTSSKIQKSFDLKFRDQNWNLDLVFDQIPTSEDLIDIGDSKLAKNAGRKITIRINTDHPFYQNFVGSDQQSIEVIMRFAMGLAIGETVARDGGAKLAGLIRSVMNEVLRKVLGK